MPRRLLFIGALVLAASASTACSQDAPPTGLAGEPSLPDPAQPAASVTPGQAIWVAVLDRGGDAAALEEPLASAQGALGEYFADRVVVKEATCYEGLPPEMAGPFVLAIQDVAEHGVHALYLEITDAPPFYGPVTLAC